MFEIQRTHVFDAWISGLRATVGGEVTELRIHSGPGYRVYCWQDGATVVVALGGGDKSTQDHDITRSRNMVQELKPGPGKGPHSCVCRAPGSVAGLRLS